MIHSILNLRIIVISIFLLSLHSLAFAQLPTSICSPQGGKRADIISTQSAYRAPNGAAITLTVPANATKVLLTISSHTSSIAAPTTDQLLGDEDFISASLVIDMSTNRSSGLLNFAESTDTTASGTNLFSWINVPFGTLVASQIANGQSAPILKNNINITRNGNILTVTETNTTLHSSYFAEYTASNTNSLNNIGYGRLVFSDAVARRTLAIPANTNLIVLSKKGTVRKSNYASGGGTEEGYSDAKYVIDLNQNTINGFNTVANGANIAFRSTYSVVNHTASDSTQFLNIPIANRIGDFTGKSTTSNSTNDIGIENPRVFRNGNNLVISRDAAYRADFDDVYLVEFFQRTGLGMSVEFIESKSAFIPKGGIPGGSGSGAASRTVNIPAGANFIFIRQAGNANNSTNAHNENAIASYAVIDLTNETANGYFWQQVGFTDQTTRRDDNYTFSNLPLNGTSSRNPSFSSGYYSLATGVGYDVDFTLSANKSQITIRNRCGLVANQYQILTNLDFFGARPDFAFSTQTNVDYKIANQGTCGSITVELTVCNPGSGNSPGGLPISFYDKNPTTDNTARLLFTGNFPNVINQGNCVKFNFPVNFAALNITNPNSLIFHAVLNDNGSFVAGGVGNTIGNTFTLSSLANQTSEYKECDYSNNLLLIPIDSIMACPTANNLVTTNRSPTINGTWDHLNANALSVNVGSITYVLGVNPELSVVNGVWTLNLTNRIFLSGIYPVTVNSSNSKGFLLDQTTNELTIRNTPIAVNDQNSSFINTAVAGNVTTNDFDLENGARIFNSFLNASNAILTTGSTVNGIDSLGNLVTNAGTLTFNSSGVYTFTPANGFVGTVSIPYKTCNSVATTVCDTGILDISILARPFDFNSLIANNDEFVSFSQTINGSLLLNDADPQGHTFNLTSFRFDRNGDGIIDSTSTDFGNPIQVGGFDKGKSSTNNAGALTLNSNGTFNFVPANGFVGEVNFSYTICDDYIDTACATASVLLTIVQDVNATSNNAPFAGDDFAYTVRNVNVNGSYINNDSDLNGNPLRVNGQTIDLNDTTIIQTIATANGGSLRLRRNGTFTYIPANNYIGPDFAAYQICDVTAVSPQPLCASATINFLVAEPNNTTGIVWSDIDNNLLNNSENGTNASGTLFINIVDDNNVVVATTAVNSNGTYDAVNFPIFKNLRAQLSINQGVVGGSAPAIALPTNWVFTGQNNDGDTVRTTPGSIPFFSTGKTIPNLGFGIQERPTANGNTNTTLPNPGSNNVEPADSTIFTGTDPDNGFIISMRISSFPTNADTIYINNVQYHANNWPNNGVSIPTITNGNPTQQIKVDPIDGDVDVEFSFFTTDNAGFESLNSSTAILPFRGVRIITLTATPVCINDVPYMDYSISANFDTTGLKATIVWRSGPAANGIANPNNNTLVSFVTLENQPLGGLALWPGAETDGNGNATNWPGWIFDNGEWVFQEDGFSGYRTNPGFSVTVNPTDTIDGGTNYPPATPACSSNPSFDVSGIVRNNVNGFDATGNAIPGSPTNINDSLYVSLVDENNNIIATTQVASNGNFSFNELKTVDYAVVLHTNSLGSATPSLPFNWVSTSQGANTVYNTTGNGVCEFAVSASTFVEFGVQQRPTAGDGNAPVPALIDTNPARRTFIPVPRTIFIGSDQDGGTITGIRIDHWPSNMVGLQYKDTTFYEIADSIPGSPFVPGTCPTSFCKVFDGLTVLFNGSNWDSDFEMDPVNEATNLGFNFNVLDNAGFESLNQFQAIVNFNTAPLSVGCDDFAGVNKNGIVTLSWSTSTETNNLGFRIERSTNGLDFQEIGFVNGAGNSSITTQYAFNDRTPEVGNNYYRLISIDNNQKESFECKVVSVRVDVKATSVQVYPNPSNGIIYLSKGLEVVIQIDLMDANGKILITKFGDMNEISFQHLADGVYYLRVRTQNGVSTHKIINY